MDMTLRKSKGLVNGLGVLQVFIGLGAGGGGSGAPLAIKLSRSYAILTSKHLQETYQTINDAVN